MIFLSCLIIKKLFCILYVTNLHCFSCQTELERERIALELEEEKKTQAEWEKRVKEQAKKIENLSSMVLLSNRDESREHIKKVFLINCTFLSGMHFFLYFPSTDH